MGGSRYPVWRRGFRRRLPLARSMHRLSTRPRCAHAGEEHHESTSTIADRALAGDFGPGRLRASVTPPRAVDASIRRRRPPRTSPTSACCSRSRRRRPPSTTRSGTREARRRSRGCCRSTGRSTWASARTSSSIRSTSLTATQIVPPEPNCPPPPDAVATALERRQASPRRRGSPTRAAERDGDEAENVGPYATVQLHSTDPSALNNWLAQNGFNIPADVTPVIDQYVTEGFDFLAMKLLPNQGVQAMRPVRVTTPGASLSLPLRMAADRDRRDGRHHDLGRQRRPLRAAELSLLSHRGQRARLGLEHQLEQLHDAARAERGGARRQGLGDRELAQL